MKRNDPYNWTITLRGKTRAKIFNFVGRLDEALAEADEQESSVAFTVLEYRITRYKQAKANVAVRDAAETPDTQRGSRPRSLCMVRPLEFRQHEND